MVPLLLSFSRGKNIYIYKLKFELLEKAKSVLVGPVASPANLPTGVVPRRVNVLPPLVPRDPQPLPGAFGGAVLIRRSSARVRMMAFFEGGV